MFFLCYNREHEKGRIDMTFKIESNTTQVPNIFIDQYVPSAPPIYVVVYLYALRHCTNGNTSLTNDKIALELEILESDVVKAWNYWHEQGIVNFDEKNKTIEFLLVKEKKLKQTQNKTVVMEKRPNYSSEEICIYLEKSEKVKQLFLSAQDHLGKLLSQNDMNILFSFYDWLRLPMNVIEILLGYCVENGHRDLRYIERVAIDWADNGIDTPQKAMEWIRQRDAYTKGYKKIMKAFGQGSRMPSPVEETFIKKWLEIYQFPLDVIVKACEKTILQTGQVSFQYADSIIENWQKKNLKTIEAVEREEKEFETTKKARATKKETVQKQSFQTQPVKKNRFVNYEQRQWDFAEMERLEMELLKKEIEEKRVKRGEQL